MPQQGSNQTSLPAKGDSNNVRRTGNYEEEWGEARGYSLSIVHMLRPQMLSSIRGDSETMAMRKEQEGFQNQDLGN